MNIQRQDDTLIIKSGSTIVNLHESAAIGTFALPGPGEYDVDGVSAIVLPNDICTIVLRVETVSLLYLDRPYELDSDNENLANIDAVAIRVSKPDDFDAAQQVIKQLEPRAYVLFGLPAEQIVDGSKLTVEPVDKWSITANSLPEEGIETAVLK